MSARQDLPEASSGTPGSPPGFTLVELLVVLVLIGIFSAVGLPGLREALLTDPLQRAALRLAGLLEQTRETAVRQHREIRLQVEGGRALLWRVDNGAASPPDREPPPRRYLLPDDVTVAAVYSGDRSIVGEVREVRFSRKGYVPATTFLLSDASGRMLSLILSPFAAEVVVREGRATAAGPGK